MPYLVIQSGSEKGKIINLDRESTTFGRMETADVILDDRNISRKHARFSVLEENVVSLVDLGSANGTFVNDLPINRIFLMDGDEIRMGETVLAYSEGKPVEKESGSIKVAMKSHSRIVPHPPTMPTEIFPSSEQEIQTESLKETYLRLRTLYTLITDITGAGELSEAIPRIAKTLLHSLSLDRIVFFRYNRAHKLFEDPEIFVDPSVEKNLSRDEYPIHGQVLDCVAREGLSYLFHEGEDTLPTIMGVPIINRDLPLGMIYIDSPLRQRPLNKKDLDFLTAVAAHLGAVAGRLENVRRLKRKNLSLERVINENLAIVCRNPEMLKIMEILDQLAEADSSVLIRGESGTGKELLARAIHSYSRRRSAPLVCINCASLPETLIESELFGHERGAFTGAVTRKPGKFELADGGTIFLDEIGDISLTAQAKILRALEEGEIQRVGGTKTIKVDVRIITATNKNLEAAMNRAEFREDLYYRLKVVEIVIPPLRERTEDIPLLAKYFLKSLRARTSSQVTQISRDAKKILMSYPWPGNVRELKNVIERALVFARGDEILPTHLPTELKGKPRPSLSGEEGIPESLSEVEHLHIMKTLDFAKGNKLRAAEILGISRSTLYEKIKQYNIRM